MTWRHANSDLQNLMAATAIATVFLDRELRIMRYTPSAAPLFHLIPGDLGRPLTDLRQRLDYPELVADAEQVLRTLIPVEREVREEGHWLLARVQPYRTVEDHIAGVVLTFMDITERRMASQALAKSEEKYRTLFDSMDQGYCIIQMLYDGERPVDWRCLEVNPAFEKHTGLANAKGRTMREMAPAIEPKWIEIYGRVAATGESLRFEEDSPTLGGRVFDLYAFRVGEPAERRVAVIFTNVTERKRHVERQAFLIRLNDALRPLGNPVEIKTTGARLLGEHLGVNRAFYADAENGHWLVAKGYVRGVEPLPDVPYPMGEYGQWIIDDFRAGRPLILPDVLSEARFQPSERAANKILQIRGAAAVPQVKDGALVALLCVHTAAPRDWNGEEVALLQEAAGRTWAAVERARAEEALRDSQERLQLVIENAREYAIFSMDLERRITTWNTGAQAILGYTHEEAIGRSADIIFTLEDRAAGAPAQEAATALTEGRAADERWHLRKDGGRFWGSGVMTAMHDAQNEAIGLLKIFRDETVARETQQALEASLEETERARAEAEAAGQAKDHFLAVLSHELRTPLMPVLLAVDMLARRMDLPEPARDALNSIRSNVELESHFIDELLDVTRIGRGKFEIARQPMDLHEAIRRAITISEPDIQDKEQRLTVELNATEHQLNGDFTRLQQVVWNLLKNASKFTPEGGGIWVRTRNEPAVFVLEVSDNGIGIDREALSRIFDAFAQANEAISRQYGGLGLGLAITKATVDAHGGELHADSAGSGKGATFRVSFPLT